jgi:hypothetical protein
MGNLGKHRNVSPHEPDEPIAGVEEAIRDSELMARVWEEKKRRRAAEASKKRLQADDAEAGARQAKE